MSRTEDGKSSQQGKEGAGDGEQTQVQIQMVLRDVASAREFQMSSGVEKDGFPFATVAELRHQVSYANMFIRHPAEHLVFMYEGKVLRDEERFDALSLPSPEEITYVDVILRAPAGYEPPRDDELQGRYAFEGETTLRLATSGVRTVPDSCNDVEGVRVVCALEGSDEQRLLKLSRKPHMMYAELSARVCARLSIKPTRLDHLYVTLVEEEATQWVESHSGESSAQAKLRVCTEADTAVLKSGDVVTAVLLPDGEERPPWTSDLPKLDYDSYKAIHPTPFWTGYYMVGDAKTDEETVMSIVNGLIKAAEEKEALSFRLG